MDKVSEWIEAEMRQIDPDAYRTEPLTEDSAARERALTEALEARAAAAGCAGRRARVVMLVPVTVIDPH